MQFIAKKVTIEQKFSMTTFFFRGSKSGRPLTVKRFKLGTQTLLQVVGKGWNCGLVGVSITSGNRKCPKKIYTLTLKIIGCERKCHFFHFFVALIKIWLQHQINSIILGIIPTFYVWIRPIQENKKFTSSDCHHCFLTFFRFSSYFRLPDMIETYPKPQFGPLPTTCKKVWVSSLNRLAVRGRPDLDPRKKKSSVESFRIF